MTFAELYAALEKLEKGSEYVETIKAEIARLNGEAKQHREAKEKVEGEKKTLEDKVKDLEKAGAGSKSEFEVLQQQMQDLQSKYETAEKARVEAEAKRVKAEITQQTIDALTKENAANPSEIAKILVANVKADKDGKYTYTGSDGKEVSIAEGAKGWLAANTWAVKNTQAPGSGGRGNGGGGNNPPPENTLAAAVASALGSN